MDYTTLAKVTEQMALRKPIPTRFSCDQKTYDWLCKTFINDMTKFVHNGGYFGVPIHVVDHLAYGFIEAEMDDGTRQIIRLTKPTPTKPSRTDTQQQEDE